MRGHRGNGAGLRQNAPAHPEAAAQAQQQGQHHGGNQAAHHETLHVLALLHIVPDQHLVAAGQGKIAGPHFVLARLVAERHRHLEQKPFFLGVDFWPRRDIPRHRTQLRIDHEIDRAAYILILRALLDQFDEVAARQHQHLLTQTLHFRFDQIVGAAVDDARDRKIHGIDERRRSDREHNRIDDGDTEG